MTNTIRRGIDPRIARRVAEIEAGSERRERVHSNETSPDPSAGVQSVLRRSVGVVYRLSTPVLAPLAWRVRRYLVSDVQKQIALEINHVVHLMEQMELRLRHASDVVIPTSIAEASAAGVQQAQFEGDAVRRDLRALQSAFADVAGRLDRVPGLVHGAIQPSLDHLESQSALLLGRVAVPLPPDLILARTVVGYVLCATTDPAALVGLIETGDIEPGTRSLIERVLRPGGCMVDVGANLGLHALAAARAVGPSGMVIAIEPYAPTADLLTRSLALNGYSRTSIVHQVAASDRIGVETLFLGPTSGHHSLYELQDQGDGVAVELRPLDEIVPVETRVDLVKIDVEGAELSVVRGARGLIDRNEGIGIIAEFGPSHLERTGVSAEDWFGAFTDLGLSWLRIDASQGSLERSSIEQVATEYSTNVFFAVEGSEIWQRALDG